MKMRQVPINVSEGTWMNLDVSPDGRTIAFDFLATSTRCRSRRPRHPDRGGMPYETQPRFLSRRPPDRLYLDRAGGENIWIMNTTAPTEAAHQGDVHAPQQPDLERGRQVQLPRASISRPSAPAGTGEVWMYHVAGGSGVALVERPNPQFQKELGEPMFTPAGDAIYFSRNTTPGNTFEYAQNSNEQLFAIERYDLKTGERTTVAGGPGGAVRPAPSPDGRYLAYVKRERAKSKLYVKDLRSGQDARSMTISTRTCRRPGRSMASIRTWTSLRTAARSSSGPAARSAESISTAPARPRSRSRSPTRARWSIRRGRR
jgi:Tol biopolymer transport system component